MLNLIIIIIMITRKCLNHGSNPTQSNPCGLGWTPMMGWDFFNPTFYPP